MFSSTIRPIPDSQTTVLYDAVQKPSPKSPKSSLLWVLCLPSPVMVRLFMARFPTCSSHVVVCQFGLQGPTSSAQLDWIWLNHRISGGRFWANPVDWHSLDTVSPRKVLSFITIQFWSRWWHTQFLRSKNPSSLTSPSLESYLSDPNFDIKFRFQIKFAERTVFDNPFQVSLLLKPQKNMVGLSPFPIVPPSKSHV